MPFDADTLHDLVVHWLGGGRLAYWAATAAVILVSTLFIWILWVIFDRARKGLHRWIDAKDRGLQGLRIQDQPIFTEREIARFLHKAVNSLWSLLRLALVLFWANLIFTQFDWSRKVALRVIDFFVGLLSQFAGAIVDYLPNLAVIFVIVLISRLFIRVLRGIFDGIRLERIALPGFYPEWSETSFGLMRLMVIALTVVIVFPYLPGSDSPAFQGVSIFFGVLLSLGSTSAIANIIAGIVITYTRAFKIGDRVRISDTEGDVIERSAFVTRIRTPKNVEVAIPNASVMNDHIVNFSAQAKKSGVLIHTTVTIGYDIPWPQVHELLQEAARRTDQLLDEPAPFVLQTSLDDNYVAYELNAYTHRPSGKQKIASDMHANIQDCFREADIEILSPHYRGNRDGSALTIPPVHPGQGGADITRAGGKSEPRSKPEPGAESKAE